MEFFVVVLLILGVPFIIGLIIGIAIGKSRRQSGHQTPPRPALAQAWEQGFHAGRQSQSAPADQQQVLPPAPPEPRVHSHQPQPPIFPQMPRLQSPPPPRSTYGPGYQTPPPSHPMPAKPPNTTVNATSTAQQRKTRHQRATRNINITLYAATLLIVAAAGLFIGAGLPAAVIMFGLGVITLAFYAAGLILHAVTTRLQPAAIAFVGTGIALVPINAVTWWLQTEVAGTHIWLIASLVGLAMTFGATIRLQSTVGIYLTLPLLASSVTAGGASLQRGYVWALLFLVLLSIAIMCVLTVHQRRRGQRDSTTPRSFTDRYVTALAQTNVIVVPATILVSWLMPAVLRAPDYFMLYLVATVYFVSAIFLGQRKYRTPHTIASYITGFLTAIAAVNAFNMAAMPGYVLLGSYVGIVALTIYAIRWKTSPVSQGRHKLGGGSFAGIAIAFGVGAIIGLGYQFDLQPEPPGSWNPVWLLFLAIAALITAHRRTLVLTAGKRLVLTAWIPTMLLPVYVLYPYSGWIALATTIAIIVLYGVYYLTTTTKQPAPYYDKYWIGHITAAFGIVLGTQIVLRFNDHAAVTVLTATLLATIWATATIAVRAKHMAAVDVPTIVWATLIVITALTNIVTAFHYDVDTSVARAMVIGYGVALGVYMITVARGVRSAQGTLRPIRTQAVVLLAVQVLSMMIWQLFATLWVVIVALVVLAAWFHFLAAARRVVTSRFARLGLAGIGQITLMIASPMVVAELNGTASLQRLVTAAVATAGIVLLSRGPRARLRLPEQTVHRWAVAVIVIGLLAVEMIVGYDRIITVAMLGLLIAVLTLLGTAGGGVWLMAPALWLAGWNLSAYPNIFNGVLLQPLYSETSLIVVTLGAAVSLGALYIVGRHQLFAQRNRTTHQQLQYLSALVFLLVVGYSFSLTLATHNVALIMGGLFLAAATIFIYAAMMHTRRSHIIWAVIVGALATATHAYLLVQHNMALETWWVAPAAVWGFIAGTALLLIALGHRIMTATRGVQANSGMHTGILLRQTALLIVATGALAALWYELTWHHVTVDLNTIQAWSSALLAVVTVWGLAIEMTLEHKPFPKLIYGYWVHWSAQTVAVILTMSIIASTWWSTRIHPEPTHALFWMWTIVVGFVIAWGARFMLSTPAAAQRWRNVMWYTGAGLFVMNSLILLTTGTGWMQLAGLFGFAVLLALGLINGLRALSIIGAAGITASVLWYLRDLTFVWVGLLGIALLGVAIWQLRRTSAGPTQKHESAPDTPTPDSQEGSVELTPPPPPRKG